MTEEKLRALSNFHSSTLLTENERLALRYAAAMTQTPVHVDDELFAELAQHYSHAQLVELTSCIAWENYRARFDHAFGIESQGFSEGAFCPIPDGNEH